MTDQEKLYGAYYQPNRLWTGGKAIKEPHKITSMLGEYIRSWLAKEELWKIYIPPPKEINHPQYDATKPNEQHHFDLLYMTHNVFEGNTYKYVLTGIDAESRYKNSRAVRNKNSSKVAFVLESTYKNCDVIKYFNVVIGMSLKMK